jgi:hypothetical protein
MNVEENRGSFWSGGEKNKGNNQKNNNEDTFFCPFY